MQTHERRSQTGFSIIHSHESLVGKSALCRFASFATIIVRAREFGCPSKIVINFIALTANWRDRAHGGKFSAETSSLWLASILCYFRRCLSFNNFSLLHCTLWFSKLNDHRLGSQRQQMARENFGVHCTFNAIAKHWFFASESLTVFPVKAFLSTQLAVLVIYAFT